MSIRTLVVALFIGMASLQPLHAQVGGDPSIPPGFILMDDMILPDSVLMGDSYFNATPWTNGVVPYRFDPSVTILQAVAFSVLFAELEAICGVDFIPWSGETNFVTIRPNGNPSCPNNCSSATVGMAGGEQFVNVGSNHWTNRFVSVHELMHTLGFRHEHQRPDRNAFVQVNWGNISNVCTGMSNCGQPGVGNCCTNFSILNGGNMIGPYDYQSLMHYGTSNFSVGSTQTLTPLQPTGGPMGQRSNISLGDATALQTMYGAAPRPTVTSLSPSQVVAPVSWPITVDVNGDFFCSGSTNGNGVQGSQVLWNGQPVPTTFISQNQLQFQVDFLMLPSGGGCGTVQVRNPTPGGGTSFSLAQFNHVNLASTPGDWRGLQPNDNLGQGVAGLGDVNGDGVGDVVAGISGTFSDDGRVTCYSGATGAAIWSVPGGSNHELGFSIARTGDLNADGIFDVIVGAPGYSNDRGRVNVYSGADGTLLQATFGSNAGDQYGYAVATAGDANNDGYEDRVIGIPGFNNDGGRVVLIDATNGAVLFAGNGINQGDRLGSAVAGGADMGGGSGPDFAAGSPLADFGSTNNGRVTVFSGQAGQVLGTRVGLGNQDRYGHSLWMVPARNGTSGQLLVGAPESYRIGFLAANTGPGYVQLLSPGATLPPDGTWFGDSGGDAYGSAVSTPGDVNEDGFVEIAIGAAQWYGIDRGYVRVLDGATGQVAAERTGLNDSVRFGERLAPGLDADGDGRHDLLVGDPLSALTCIGGGQMALMQVPMPPDPFRLMISEVSWGNPDGLEITNYGNATVDLSGYRVLWDDGLTASPKISFPVGNTLAAGAKMIFVESGGSFAEAPVGIHTGIFFSSLSTLGQALTVSLRAPNGVIMDEVRISDSAGQHDLGTLGGGFRGLVVRTGSDVTAERIEGLDSNSGADWTVQTQTSMGLTNRCSGPRGTDPLPPSGVLITELDDNPDYIELQRVGTGLVQLQGWYFRCSQGSLGSDVLIEPWPHPHPFLAPFMVIGDTNLAPAELNPMIAEYVSLISVGGGNIPWVGTEFGCALYDSHGRLADLVLTYAASGPVGHHSPRLPSAWDDFLGAAPRTTLGDQSIGRQSGAPDTNLGGDWTAEDVRSMGRGNQFSNFVGLPGSSDPLDVHFLIPRRDGTIVPITAGMTIIFRAGPARAFDTYTILASLGHQNGTGPILGLGSDAITNWINVLQYAPWTGSLDANGSARIDLDSGIPSGLSGSVSLDAVFLVANPDGTSLIFTPILEFDS